MKQLSKEITIQYVNEKYGFDVTDNDIADALGIAAFVASNKTKVTWE